MPVDFDAYFKALSETARERDETEHTDRAALQRLLQQAADEVEPGARITHEPKRAGSGLGSPDFKISRAGRIAGMSRSRPSTRTCRRFSSPSRSKNIASSPTI